MTTIAWDGKTLAADSMVTGNGMRIGRITKAYRVGRLLVGLAGTVGLAQAFLHWLAEGAKGDPPSMKAEDGDAEVMVVLPDGRIATFDKYGRDQMASTQYAIGSGGRFALGAMAAGADARRAVEIASELDCFSGGPITTLVMAEAFEAT